MNIIDVEEKSQLLPEEDYQAIITDCSITPENIQWKVEKSIRIIWKITSPRENGATISQRFYIYSNDPAKKKKQEKKFIHLNKILFGQNKKTNPSDYKGCQATISISSFSTPDGQIMNYIKSINKPSSLPTTNITPHYPITDSEVVF